MAASEDREWKYFSTTAKPLYVPRWTKPNPPWPSLFSSIVMSSWRISLWWRGGEGEGVGEQGDSWPSADLVAVKWTGAGVKAAEARRGASALCCWPLGVVGRRPAGPGPTLSWIQEWLEAMMSQMKQAAKHLSPITTFNFLAEKSRDDCNAICAKYSLKLTTKMVTLCTGLLSWTSESWADGEARLRVCRLPWNRKASTATISQCNNNKEPTQKNLLNEVCWSKKWQWFHQNL